MAGLSSIGEKDESSHQYIAYLCADAALGIDFIMQGKESEYAVHVSELAELMDKYSKKCNSEDYFCWPYMTLWKALMQEKKKEIRLVSELSLEMKLFAMDLFDVKNLSEEKQKELLHLCCTASGYFMAGMPGWKKYFAA